MAFDPRGPYTTTDSTTVEFDGSGRATITHSDGTVTIAYGRWRTASDAWEVDTTAIEQGLAAVAVAVMEYADEFLDKGEEPNPDNHSAPHDPLTDDDWPALEREPTRPRPTRYRRGWARPPPVGGVPPGDV